MKKVRIVLLCTIGLGMMNAQQEQPSSRPQQEQSKQQLQQEIKEYQSYEIGVVNANFTQKKRNPKALMVKKKIIGNWNVVEVSGKIYVKTSPTAQEIESPMTLFLGKKFIFDGLMLTIKDGNKKLKKSRYTFANDYTALNIPKYSGTQTIGFRFSNGKLIFSQTPEACYEILANQMNKTIDQIKTQFRVPGNLSLNLRK